MAYTRKIIIAALALAALPTAASAEQTLQSHEAEMKKTLPLRIDEVTVLENVKYEPTKTTYWFIVDNRDGSLNPHDMEQSVRKAVCTNSETVRTIRDKRFVYEYHYVNHVRAHLATFTIRNCP